MISGIENSRLYADFKSSNRPVTKYAQQKKYKKLILYILTSSSFYHRKRFFLTFGGQFSKVDTYFYVPPKNSRFLDSQNDLLQDKKTCRPENLKKNEAQKKRNALVKYT
jgi:hypothetical protein